MRVWWNRFGPLFAVDIRKKRSAALSAMPQWRWHLDEVFVKINGETHYLWRAVDHEGEVLEVYATKHRDRKAAMAFLKRTMKRYGRPQAIVTDCLRSYGAAMKVIGNAAVHECGRWLNNRAENSHQLFRRRERVMAKFRDIKTLQKFAATHALIHNHFNRGPPPQPAVTSSRKTAPPPWPSGGSLRSEIYRLQGCADRLAFV